ncbi:MAG: hypothetical protein L0331_18295, partial [Chloroflexi bacterium]|nr:hypothetical protein [Chloroflexota bacterium]
NTLMVSQAVFGRLPQQLPASLEEIIDASVKTGADLNRVKEWNYRYTRELLRRRKPVPGLLHGRLSRSPDSPPSLPTNDHWLDRLEQGVKGHIAAVEARRDELVRAARPPRELFDSAFGDPAAVALGARLNQAYARTVKQLAKQQPDGELTAEDHEAARRAVETYLAGYSASRRSAILRGALASAYLGETAGSDTAAWLAGARTEQGRQPGVAHNSIQALRDIGLLDEVDQMAGGVLVYPNAAPERPAYRTVGITGVWFHHCRREAEAHGRPIPEKMSSVPREQARQAKRQVAELAQSAFQGLVLAVGEAEGRKMLYTEQGTVFGYLSRDSEDVAAGGERITLKYALAKDGNLRAAVI